MTDTKPTGGVSARLGKAFDLVFTGLREASTEIVGAVEDGVQHAKTKISEKIDELDHAAEQVADNVADRHKAQAMGQGFSADEAEIIRRYIRLNYPYPAKTPTAGRGPDAGTEP